jgi:branched-subunit amino acid transport protein
MNTLLAILVVGLGTYACRAIFILAFANRKIPSFVQNTLKYVAPATLSALIVTLLIDNDGVLAVGIPELGGLISGALIAYTTRNHIYTLVAGMGVFLILGSFLTT